MKQIIKAGSTSKTLLIFVQDSSKTTGVGLTGLTNASAGLKWYYYREAAGVDVAVTIVGETLGTWTSGGFKEVDATNMPGVYEIGVPNAAIAASANSVVMELQGATNMVPVLIEVELVAFDPEDGVRLGLTALPNAAAASAGGLPTSGAGANQITLDASGRINVGKWLDQVVAVDAQNLPKVDSEDWKGAVIVAPTTPGQPKVETVINDDKTGYALSQSFPTNFSSLAITVGGAVTVATNNDKTGYSLSQAFPANFSALAITAGGAVTLNAGQITVKKNQALAGFTFPMYSSVTGNLQTGLTVISQRSIDGGAIAPTTNSVTEIGSGVYALNLSAADLNGGTITFTFTATNGMDASVTLVTQP